MIDGVVKHFGETVAPDIQRVLGQVRKLRLNIGFPNIMLALRGTATSEAVGFLPSCLRREVEPSAASPSFSYDIAVSD